MKLYFLLLVVFAGISAFAQDIGGDYYVVPPNHSYAGMAQGNDLGPGTYAEPFATWQRAFEVAQPGDTVYFRGGVWMPEELFSNTYESVVVIAPNSDPFVGYDGTEDNPIRYFNYPNETPVLDCQKVTPTRKYLTGFDLKQANYIHFKGLEVRKLLQKHESTVNCISGYGCSNLTFENINVNHVGGKGFNFVGDFGNAELFPEQTTFPGDTMLFLNCDASYCMDSIGKEEGRTDFGNYADGFWFMEDNSTPHVIFKGCRSWMNSDDGFDVPANCLVTYDSCWSFSNGHLVRGIGKGIRFARFAGSENIVGIMTNCISTHNKSEGIREGYADAGYFGCLVYNNFVYHNGEAGFVISGRRTGPLQQNIYKNNISFMHSPYDAMILTGGAVFEHSNNTWLASKGYQFEGTLPDIDPPIDLSYADFANLDTLQLYRSRKMDGSLPDITFGTLSDSSDMIDVGADVGLGFNGSAPDIGAFEYKFDPNGNEYPKIKMLAPKNGETHKMSKGVPISFSASDPGGGNVARLEILIDGAVYHTIDHAPWTFTWSTATVGYHTIRGRVIDDDGAQAFSHMIEIGVVLDSISDELLIFPNPSDGVINIYLQDVLEEDGVIDIFDANGRIVHKESIFARVALKQISLPNQGEGVYFISIYNDTEFFKPEKFIITR